MFVTTKLNDMPETEIQLKIESAREVVKELRKRPNPEEFADLVSRLAVNIDKLELVYSDVAVKEQKSIAAAKLMYDLERELEQLLAAAKDLN